MKRGPKPSEAPRLRQHRSDSSWPAGKTKIPTAAIKGGQEDPNPRPEPERGVAAGPPALLAREPQAGGHEGDVTGGETVQITSGRLGPPCSGPHLEGDYAQRDWVLVGRRRGRGAGLSGTEQCNASAIPPGGEESRLLPPASPPALVGRVTLATNQFACLAVEEASGEPIVSDDDTDEGELPAPRAYVRRPRRKPTGSMEAHVRFLQHVFRRAREVRPTCWTRGGMRGLVIRRPPTVFGCKNGLELASDEEFDEQRRKALEVTAWYEQYVSIHRRLHSGRTPTALVTFCGEGGVVEGVRRAGGAAHGQDLRPMPKFVERYHGADSGDSAGGQGRRCDAADEGGAAVDLARVV